MGTGFYKSSHFFSFIKTKHPCVIFMAPPIVEYLQPMESNQPTNIKFIHIIGIYAIPLKVWTTPSNILIFTIPTPMTSQVDPLLKETTHVFFSCNVSKCYFLEHIWIGQLKSNIHSSWEKMFILLQTVRTSLMYSSYFFTNVVLGLSLFFLSVNMFQTIPLNVAIIHVVETLNLTLSSRLGPSVMPLNLDLDLIRMHPRFRAIIINTWFTSVTYTTI